MSGISEVTDARVLPSHHKPEALFESFIVSFAPRINSAKYFSVEIPKRMV